MAFSVSRPEVVGQRSEATNHGFSFLRCLFLYYSIFVFLMNDCFCCVSQTIDWSERTLSEFSLLCRMVHETLT